VSDLRFDYTDRGVLALYRGDVALFSDRIDLANGFQKRRYLDRIREVTGLDDQTMRDLGVALEALAGQAIAAGGGLSPHRHDQPKQGESAATPGGSTPTTRITIPLSTVEPIETAWLWTDILPRGCYGVLAGDPSLGKTTLALGMAAIISRGAKWPDGSRAPRGNTIIITAEDDPARTIVPRLAVAGADLDSCFTMPVLRRDEEGRLTAWDVGDLETLERALDETEAAFVVLDPLQGLLPASTDSNNNASVRSVLGGLCELAGRRNVTILGVDHLRKAGADSAIYRVSGSIAFAAASRVTLVCAGDPSDSDRNIMAVAKANLAQLAASQAYKLVGVPGPVGVAVTAEWLGPVEITANDLLRAPRRKAADDEFKQEVQEFAAALREAVGAGKTWEGTVGELSALLNDDTNPRRLGVNIQRMKVSLPYHGVTITRLGQDPKTRARRVRVCVASVPLSPNCLLDTFGLLESGVSRPSTGGEQVETSCSSCSDPPENASKTSKTRSCEFGPETHVSSKPSKVSKTFGERGGDAREPTAEVVQDGPHKEGLQAPAAVQVATNAYREGEDVLGQFLGDRIEITGEDSDFTSSKELYDAYKAWCEEQGAKSWGQRTLAARLRDRGFIDFRTTKARGWRGVRMTFGTSYESDVFAHSDAPRAENDGLDGESTDVHTAENDDSGDDSEVGSWEM
jgi:AAA domain-containing protein/D5 protein-like